MLAFLKLIIWPSAIARREDVEIVQTLYTMGVNVNSSNDISEKLINHGPYHCMVSECQ